MQYRKIFRKFFGEKTWNGFPKSQFFDSKNISGIIQNSYWTFCMGVNFHFFFFLVQFQPVFTYSKSTVKTLERILVINNNEDIDVNDVVLVTLFLNLNRCHTLFRWFHFWLWTSKWRLGCHIYIIYRSPKGTFAWSLKLNKKYQMNWI